MNEEYSAKKWVSVYIRPKDLRVLTRILSRNCFPNFVNSRQRIIAHSGKKVIDTIYKFI